ncbi:hypothetical protein H7849_17350 [Alloacidobacterium dinghuense]|uniref:Uncharacterized protein n=1 Tax=Alloacidobacterium dinghuense TaxID=2763107 RepID=A0A7G8BEA2_9BACT|nr:hypothetical protein [Alloacidobacterium dinghuense]QNI30872.1 hypothetical protein H7849_17350 [Alloacidobacterium dinghuense]
MHVVSFVTATLVLAGAPSASGQLTAANTLTPLSQTSIEGTPLPPATTMNAPAVLRVATTAYEVDPDTIAGVAVQTISVQPSSSELSQMSKREVKTLIRSAKTSDDHREIASYFARQAQIFAKESNEYQVQSDLIAANPAKYKTNYPSAYDQSRFWEQYFATKSREAATAANLHEQLARSLAEKETEVR